MKREISVSSLPIVFAFSWTPVVPQSHHQWSPVVATHIEMVPYCGHPPAIETLSCTLNSQEPTSARIRLHPPKFPFGLNAPILQCQFSEISYIRPSINQYNTRSRG